MVGKEGRELSSEKGKIHFFFGPETHRLTSSAQKTKNVWSVLLLRIKQNIPLYVGATIDFRFFMIAALHSLWRRPFNPEHLTLEFVGSLVMCQTCSLTMNWCAARTLRIPTVLCIGVGTSGRLRIAF